MRIESIKLSVFEAPSNTGYFELVEQRRGTGRRWAWRTIGTCKNEIQVMHVRTDKGIEGICTVGDARYTTMRPHDLEQLRMLALHEDPLNRERLFAKLTAATRGMFTRPGWFGTFDNCLWDIAGKAAKLPVSALMGRARSSCPAYYNIRGSLLSDREAAIQDTQHALQEGFTAIKDHFRDWAPHNVELFRAMRETVGPQVELLHDAAMAGYSYRDALRVGRALDELGYGWFEEPIPDADQTGLKRLCEALDLPVMALETMMHDMKLSAQWLITGATDAIRANARHGATATLKLAHMAEMHSARIELNGPGGLFGLVHAHLACAIVNTSYYEYFPGGSRDAIGKEIGLTNPPIPKDGRITPPDGPGWGARWDKRYMRKVRVAEI